MSNWARVRVHTLFFSPIITRSSWTSTTGHFGGVQTPSWQRTTFILSPLEFLRILKALELYIDYACFNLKPNYINLKGRPWKGTYFPPLNYQRKKLDSVEIKSSFKLINSFFPKCLTEELIPSFNGKHYILQKWTCTLRILWIHSKDRTPLQPYRQLYSRKV